MPATAISSMRTSASVHNPRPPAAGVGRDARRFTRPGTSAAPARGGSAAAGPNKPTTKTEHEILLQKFFKSTGPRTYAAQLKRARNGNHYLVLTEGQRDEKTGDVRKARVFVYSEDFVEFFRLVKAADEFIKQNPVPPEVSQRQQKFWANGGRRARGS
jgi:hypothetical protein